MVEKEEMEIIVTPTMDLNRNENGKRKKKQYVNKTKNAKDSNSTSHKSHKAFKRTPKQSKITTIDCINENKTVLESLTEAQLLELMAPDISYQNLPTQFEDCSWYQCGNGDLKFAQWIITRCQNIGDIYTLDSMKYMTRVWNLYNLQNKLREELRAQSSHDEIKNVNDELIQSLEDYVQESEEMLQFMMDPMADEAKLVETYIMNEIIENMTELLRCYGTLNDIKTIEKWRDLIQNKLNDEKEDKKTEVKDNDEEMQQENASKSNGKLNKKKEKQRKRIQKKQMQVFQKAYEATKNFIQFLHEYHEIRHENKQTMTLKTLEYASLSKDIEDLYMSIRMTQRDVKIRYKIVKEIEHKLRRCKDWRSCELVPFGSSFSLFGTKYSDLDICFRVITPHGTPSGQDKNKTEALNQHISSDSINLDELELVEQEFQMDDTNEDPTRNHLFELKCRIDQTTNKLQDSFLDLQKNEDQWSKDEINRFHIFSRHWFMLRNAINTHLLIYEFELKPNVSPPDVNNTIAEEARHLTDIRTTHTRTMGNENKHHINEIYRLSRFLSNDNKKIELKAVITGARIPLIRLSYQQQEFVPKVKSRVQMPKKLHQISQIDVDLAFSSNPLAVENTKLLRIYASLDDRARALGIAVKHWAKLRSISDAASGYLSSYSYIILCIYFLQTIPKILPNVQHPELFEGDGKITDDVQSITKKLKNLLEYKDKSIWNNGSLLVGFFEFYAKNFDFECQVVSIRTPETKLYKQERWGLHKSKRWRISIEDPIETTRDLGCVLQANPLQVILSEFKRAYTMLQNGATFHEICEERIKPVIKQSLDAKSTEKSPNDSDNSMKTPQKSQAKRKQKNRRNKSKRGNETPREL